MQSEQSEVCLAVPEYRSSPKVGTTCRDIPQNRNGKIINIPTLHIRGRGGDHSEPPWGLSFGYHVKFQEGQFFDCMVCPALVPRLGRTMVIPGEDINVGSRSMLTGLVLGCEGVQE